MLTKDEIILFMSKHLQYNVPSKHISELADIILEIIIQEYNKGFQACKDKFGIME